MQPEGSEKAVKGAGNISKDTKERNVDSDESPKKQVLEQEVDGVQKPPRELKKPTENIEKPSEDLCVIVEASEPPTIEPVVKEPG